MRTIQSELSEKGYAKPLKDNNSIVRKKIKEKLSEREWKELMGCNRAIYGRGKGGAIRSR